jgi:hypothetical protein
MAGPFYASRENVLDALDMKAAAYTSGQVDRAIDSASRAAEGLTRRIFYPLTATKSFDWPGRQDETWTIWLDGNDIASMTTLVAGGVSIPAAGYNLEPNEYGPPYNRVEINRGSSYAFASGPLTPQRSIAMTGVWCGSPLDEANAGTLVAAITSSATTLTSTMPIGVGRILRIDSERLIVTERSFITSGQTGTLTANLNANTLAVADGTQFQPREHLLIDAERLLVVDIAGNNLIVKRAQQGSTLAAHTGAAVFYARSYTVTRGALGTTAASHLISAPIARHVPPALVEQLTIAYSIFRLLGENAGYARQVGSGSSERAGTARLDISDIEAQVRRVHGRSARQRAV